MARNPIADVFLTGLVSVSLLSAATPVFAAQEPTTPAPAPSAVPTNPDYALGIGDTVEVTLLGSTDFTTRARLGTDGSIVLPFIGAIPANGRSPEVLAEQIGAALRTGGYFAQPVVRVEVTSAASQYVTVLGHVGSPGLVPLDRPYRLSEVVARAGGRSDGGAEYVLLTRGDGKSERFDIAELAMGAKDPTVTAGDKIYVPAAENEVFYITGQIKSPGAYPAKGNLTVRMALARGGGVSEMGSEKKIKIVRDGQPLRGINLDTTKIQTGDVITVGQRLF